MFTIQHDISQLGNKLKHVPLDFFRLFFRSLSRSMRVMNDLRAMQISCVSVFAALSTTQLSLI